MTSSGSELHRIFAKCPAGLVRNACIIAHVDHGKTTLADYLISSNGIISARLAGKLRYLDNREDEQKRGITMKSSVISLYYDPLLVNLVDSPGHVDFCTEVNSAVNLADIALLVVDVVEGARSQTESLIRLALTNRLDIILVVNKLDRLVIELQLSEPEAFRHLQRLIECVNSILSQTLRGQLLETEDWHKFEAIERAMHFDPTKGNVLFASALHGYAFSLEDFAEIWSKKLGLASGEIQPFLFSPDHYLTSNRKIASGAELKGRRPVFQQFVLEPIWAVHKCALIDKNFDTLRLLSEKLALPNIRSKRLDEAFDELMRQWLPLTSAVIRAFAHAKSAAAAFASPERLSLVCGVRDTEKGSAKRLRECLRSCDPNSEITLAFVAKFLKVDEKRVALCRVMSGTLRRDSELFVFRKMQSGELEHQSVKIHNIYILFGRELLPVDSAPSGRICGVEVDDGWVSGNTLCSEQLDAMDFVGYFGGFQRFAEPLVRVVIRPSSGGLGELEELREALKQLAILDSAVRVFELETGDLALVTAGEVHMQKCLEDLSALGQTDIIVSEPIVPFLETVVPSPQTSFAKIHSEHITECFLRQYSLRITVRAVPLPQPLVDLLKKNAQLIDTLREGITNADISSRVDDFQQKLVSCACEHLPKFRGSWWTKMSVAEVEDLFARNIWSFGPSRAKFNVLLNASGRHAELATEVGTPSAEIPSTIWAQNFRPLEQAIVAGFHLAMAQGPLCDEPIQGVGIVLEGWVVGDVEAESNGSGAVENQSGEAQLHGQLISAFRQTCRAALKKHPLRLLAAMYKCTVQSSDMALGKVNDVLSQRKSKVISTEVDETTNLYEITAHMPVVESFSFCENLRKRTSGVASAQLEFSHWQLIDEDPFWVPTTEDEMEEFGASGRGDTVNQAKLYVDSVRRRKGIPTDDMIIVNAEKQRNLKRNK